jgi:hypothetical protein
MKDRKLKKRGRGMKDKSMVIVTRISEDLVRIKPTDRLRLTKREARKKGKYSGSSGNSPVKILGSRYTCKKKSPVCKVLIDLTRSAYDDRQEEDGVRAICI